MLIFTAAFFELMRCKSVSHSAMEAFARLLGLILFNDGEIALNVLSYDPAALLHEIVSFLVLLSVWLPFLEVPQVLPPALLGLWSLRRGVSLVCVSMLYLCEIAGSCTERSTQGMLLRLWGHDPTATYIRRTNSHDDKVLVLIRHWSPLVVFISYVVVSLIVDRINISIAAALLWLFLNSVKTSTLCTGLILHWRRLKIFNGDFMWGNLNELPFTVDTYFFA